MIQRTAPAKGELVFRAAEIAKGEKSRTIRFVASDESTDRYGDIIRASGWQLDNFRKNPVLLFGHKSSAPPVGRVPQIAIEGTRLIADAEFMPEGMDAFADSVWRMVDGGFLNASSVGFMPLADVLPIFGPDKDLTGFEFVAQELLELSVVPVPANPQALALARSFDLSRDDLRRLFARDEMKILAEAAHRRRSLDLVRLDRR